LSEQFGTATEPPPRPHAGRGAVIALFGLLGVIIVAGVVAGLLPRLSRGKALQAAYTQDGERRPAVNVVAVRAAGAKGQLELPGDIQALIESPIFARVDGYIGRRLADYGDRVKTGQLLAEIDTPELDQQILQARATLSQWQSTLKELEAALTQAKAQLELARVTAERWRGLVNSGVLARQGGDEKEADLKVHQADVATAEAKIDTAHRTVEANEANLRRLEEMKSFARIVAPFEGIITSRNTDVGTLVSAGSSGRELFRLAQIQTVRVFVNVPQSFIAGIRIGQPAELRVQQLPGQVFTARVTRTTSSLDASSRALLVVLEVANPAGLLLPGMYAQVQFTIPRAGGSLLVPGDCLVLGREGPRVAAVGADQRVHYKRIDIVRDYGSELEVNANLAPGDLLVVSPSDEVRENTVVDVHKK
jgi:RND family efflux transporter MFP subunit